MNDFVNIFGGEELSSYQSADVIFEDGEHINLESPELIATINDFLYLKSANRYECIKIQGLYRIVLNR